MSIRKLGLLIGALCAVVLFVPATAGAQTPPGGVATKNLKRIPISGKAQNGKTFTGHFTVDRFVSRHGKTYALGTLSGAIGKRHVSRSNVAIPTKVDKGGAASAAATCPILHLVLGPLSLNLLGLHVNLNQVVLDITAQSGPGNLLGNLLCSVSNLLNGQTLLSQQLTGLLNIVQQLLAVPSLLSF
jgi:hypothetical protein